MFQPFITRAKLSCHIMAIVMFSSCEKQVEPDFGPTPDLGSKSVILLNGIHVNYTPLVEGVHGTNYVRYHFIQNRGAYTNHFIPFLDDIRVTGDQSHLPWVFSQTKNGDSNNHKYKQINTDLTKFVITEIDSNTQVVKCTFDVWFARTKSGDHNTDSYLPDTLHYEGTIDTLYLR